MIKAYIFSCNDVFIFFFCRLMTRESEIRFVYKEMGIVLSWGGVVRLVNIIGNREVFKVLIGVFKLDLKKVLDIGMVEEVL